MAVRGMKWTPFWHYGGVGAAGWHQAGQKGEVGTWMACMHPASQLARCSHTRTEWTVYAGVFIPLCNAVVIFSDTLPASSPSRGKNTLARSLSLVYIHNAFRSPALFWRVQTAITTISRCSCKPLEKRKPLIFMTKSSRLAMHARIDRLWAELSDAWESAGAPAAAGKCDALLLLFRQRTMQNAHLTTRPWQFALSLMLQPWVHFGKEFKPRDAFTLRPLAGPNWVLLCHPVWTSFA